MLPLIVAFPPPPLVPIYAYELSKALFLAFETLILYYVGKYSFS